MSNETTIRIKRRSFRNWVVIRDDAKRASKVLPTKDEAIEFGRQLAKNSTPSILVIYDRKNVQQTKHNYINN